MLKMVPKLSKNQSKQHQKQMQKYIENYYPKYAKLSDLGIHFGTICVAVSRVARFVRDLFFGTLGGNPLGPI